MSKNKVLIAALCGVAAIVATVAVYLGVKNTADESKTVATDKDASNATVTEQIDDYISSSSDNVRVTTSPTAEPIVVSQQDNRDEPAPSRTENSSTYTLNLPLVVKDNTFTSRLSSYEAKYITSDGYLIDKGHNPNLIDMNVRSVYKIGDTILYIKGDNTLYGYGSNRRGRLGDGTGLDQPSPVKIMNDVADIFWDDFNAVVLALKTDKTLWRWGSGKYYEPTLIAENIVKVKKAFPSSYSQPFVGINSQGMVVSFNAPELPSGLFDEPIIDFMGIIDNTFWWNNEIASLDYYGQLSFFNNLFYINGKNELWYVVSQGLQTVENSEVEERFFVFDKYKIADNVASVHSLYYFSDDKTSIFYITNDSTLWGYGGNKVCQLGDGSAVPRDIPVKIAENVAKVYRYAYLKTNGEYWEWSSTKPNPYKAFEDVAFVGNGGILFGNGDFTEDKKETNSGIKIPQVYEFGDLSSAPGM